VTGVQTCALPIFCKKGKDVTIVSMSYLTLEALSAAKYLDDNFNINEGFILLVKNNFDKTRKIILTQNQSKTSN
jgi:transketolase C-terminal domain/subunit